MLPLFRSFQSSNPASKVFSIFFCLSFFILALIYLLSKRPSDCQNYNVLDDVAVVDFSMNLLPLGLRGDLSVHWELKK
jgi:hypothetical protein